MTQEIEESTEINWLDEEISNLSQGNGEFEKKPSPVFEENKITRMKIDASEPFRKWKDQERGTTKAIIPCRTLIEGELKEANWWLNLQNPVYRDVIRTCRDATDKKAVELAVLQTGSKQSTRYTLVKGE